MAGIRSTQPSVDPISITVARDYLRLEDEYDDRLVQMMIKASTEWVENQTGRALINRTVTMYLDGIAEADHPLVEGFYNGAYNQAKINYIELPLGPTYSFTGIKSFKEDGTEEVFASTNYYVNTVDPVGKVVLNDGAAWPSDLRNANGIEVTYVAGYGNDGGTVPEALRLAILQHLAFTYEHRGDFERYPPPQVPSSIASLIQPYKILRFSNRANGVL